VINILEPCLNGNEKKYIVECIEENWISSQGRFVSAFEEASLRGLDGRVALATCNGTVAIHLALLALDVKPGDEVIVPNITFGATLNAVMYTGAIPVIVDIDEDDWNMSRTNLNDALSDKTVAVIPVALFGNPTGITELADWAYGQGIKTVIDAAEAVGSIVNGCDIGGIGDVVTYSFFGNKTITTGEGGIVIFKDPSIAEKARVLRDHGMTPGRRYHHEVVGFNYRMTNLQAAVGVAQYEKLNEIIEKRTKVVERYRANLDNNSVYFQKVSESAKSSNWICAVLLPKDALLRVATELENNDIGFRRCFEPMAEQPAFSSARVVGELKTSRDIFERLLMLPTHVNLTNDDVDYISACFLRGLSSSG
jgi:perosamine synthetase